MSVTFEMLLFTLRELLRVKVKNGELTERGMARSTGVSQPHLHNILKGIRTLPPELADQLLTLAGMDLPHLMGMRRLDEGGSNSVRNEKIRFAAELQPSTLPSYQLVSDHSMEPRFRAGDIVHYERGARDRSVIQAHSAYLVSFDDKLRVRYLRMGGQRLYLVSEDSLRDPVKWDYVSLADRHILEIVRGRIVWICRKMEEVETGSSEETSGFDRRVGGEG